MNFTPPEIRTIAPKKLVGQHVLMSLNENKTQVLWSKFMPDHRTIQHRIGTDLYSLQLFPESFDFVTEFNFNTPIQKWAAVEVSNWDDIPKNMETLPFPGGLHAVFHYKGRPQDFAPMFQYIYFQWLAQSPYALDDRPHFEILGERYKNNDPESEEEIWVPIRMK